MHFPRAVDNDSIEFHYGLAFESVVNHRPSPDGPMQGTLRVGRVRFELCVGLVRREPRSCRDEVSPHAVTHPLQGLEFH